MHLIYLFLHSIAFHYELMPLYGHRPRLCLKDKMSPIISTLTDSSIHKGMSYWPKAPPTYTSNDVPLWVIQRIHFFWFSMDTEFAYSLKDNR